MKTLIIITIAIAIIACIFALPLLFIWALNTLFSLNLAYTFVNWAASFILILLFGSKTPSISYSKD